MLAEADYGLTAQAHDGHSNRFNGDDALLVRFFMRPHKDETQSREQGRPIFVEKPYIEIMQPGNKDSIVSRPARDSDRERFPKHWRKFEERQQEEHIEGTLLEEWPGISRAQVEELRYFNVRTLEQLVAMSDSNAQGIMGINLLKKRAEAYLEAAEIEAAAEELAERDARIEELEATLAKMAARIEALEED